MSDPLGIGDFCKRLMTGLGDVCTGKDTREGGDPGQQGTSPLLMQPPKGRNNPFDVASYMPPGS
jgi:hypothetical protein